MRAWHKSKVKFWIYKNQHSESGSVLPLNPCLASDKLADALLATLFRLGTLLPPLHLGWRNLSHKNKYGCGEEDAECLRPFDVALF